MVSTARSSPLHGGEHLDARVDGECERCPGCALDDLAVDGYGYPARVEWETEAREYVADSFTDAQVGILAVEDDHQ
jgi:hypothetical protein